jgi:hypothetical protein
MPSLSLRGSSWRHVFTSVLALVLSLLLENACGPKEDSSDTDSSHSGNPGAAASGHTGAEGGSLSATTSAPSTGGTGGSSSSSTSDPLACASSKLLSCQSLDSSRLLSALTAQELRALCDCVAEYAGGYGTPVSCNCPDGSPGGLQAPTSQAVCSSHAYPTACKATVGEFTRCMNAFWAKPCDKTAIMTAVTESACTVTMTNSCS